MFKRYFVRILPIIFFLFFAVHPAGAFTISPAKILLTMDAGSEKTVSLNVKNDEKKDIPFSLYAVGMKQDELGRSVFTNEKTGAVEWVNPEENRIELKSGESKNVNFRVAVPNGSFPGSYFFGLAVEPEVGVGEEVGLKGKSAAIVLLQVAGIVNESLDIENWHGDRVLLFGNKNWRFNLRCKNVGNIDLPMQAKVEVIGWNGNIAGSEEIDMGNRLLSGTSRQLRPSLNIYKNLMWPGPYEARATIVYGRTGQTAAATDTIWYFPGWILGLAGAVFAIFILKKFYIYEMKKHHHNK